MPTPEDDPASQPRMTQDRASPVAMIADRTAVASADIAIPASRMRSGGMSRLAVKAATRASATAPPIVAPAPSNAAVGATATNTTAA